MLRFQSQKKSSMNPGFSIIPGSDVYKDGRMMGQSAMIRFILILLLSSSLYASSPVSGTIGPVQTSVEEGSITGIALKAASEEYTEAWLDQYAVDKVSFGEAYSSLLSDTLPLSDLIASGERNGAVSVMSLESGTVLSFIFTDGRISAVSLSP